MADRTVNKIFETSGSDRLPVPIANGETLPIGTLVQAQSGFANHYDGTQPLIGLVVGGENVNSDGEPVGDTSLTPDPAVYVDATGAVIKGIAVAGATTFGEEVYCNDSDLANATITQPSTDAPIGYTTRWASASDCDVKLYSMDVHRLGSDAASFAAWV